METYSIAATTMTTNPAAPNCALFRLGAAFLNAAVAEAEGIIVASVPVDPVVVGMT